MTSPRTAILAAVISTLEPYLVWHDVHLNREILDQFLGASMVLGTLIVAERRTWRPTIALGVVSGIAILSNSRLVALPLVLAAYLLWRHVPVLAVAGLLVASGAAVSPWLVRNKLDVGCFAITTDGRSLWKANNPATYSVLAHGGSIDNVNPHFPGATQITPEYNWSYYIAHEPLVKINECAQMTLYENQVISWVEHNPGAKAKLMVQATELLWQPAVRDDTGGPNPTGVVEFMREVVEPIYMIPLYLLALAGLFVVPVGFRVLALSFVVYETAEAWVFAGTTRYRVAWDFILALLAAAALARIPWSRVPFARRFSQSR